MLLLDVLVKEYVMVGEKIGTYKKKFSDESKNKDLRKEFRSMAYLIKQQRFIEKALAANGFDIEKLLLKRATGEAIAKAHGAGIATTHGDDEGVYRLYPNGEKEHIVKKN
ncbi:MAG: hypothetical protein RIN56_13135 [Sporomusaceae bacterium]|nr:hypothetical protein [Sporomusaceae bacterium]